MPSEQVPYDLDNPPINSIPHPPILQSTSPQPLTMVGLWQDWLHWLLGAEREVEDVGQVSGTEARVNDLGRHTQLQVVALRVDHLWKSVDVLLKM